MKPGRQPGTYILWLHCQVQDRCRIGRLGTLMLQPGCYAYVGSAFGPGGLAARLDHHLRIQQRPRWHIDYLRRHTAVREVWYSLEGRYLEHLWAERLLRHPDGQLPLPGFGSSDCNCQAHLAYFPKMPQPFDEEGLRRWYPV